MSLYPIMTMCSAKYSHLIVRADATPAIGAGHVMRCLAFIQYWLDKGGSAALVGRIELDWVLHKVRQVGVLFHPLSGNVPTSEDCTDILRQLASGAGEAAPQQTLTVLDGYHFGSSCQKSIRSAGYGLLVIDDFNALGEYDADVLLNQNVGAADHNYAGQIGIKLLGPRYVLLRQEFLTVKRQVARKEAGARQHILLTLGGGDSSAKLSMLEEIIRVCVARGADFRVIRGETPVAEWKKLFKAGWNSVSFVNPLDDMAEQLAWADFCISAAGSTCWELCAAKVPFAVLAITERQQALVDSLVSEKIAYDLDAATAAFRSGIRMQTLDGAERIEGDGVMRCWLACQSGVV